jgi:antitoxin HicB
MKYKMQKQNPLLGSRFDDFLKHEGIFEKVQARALERALAESIEDKMNAVHIPKT